MKQVMNYNKDNGLLNMIRRTDPMISMEDEVRSKKGYQGRSRNCSTFARQAVKKATAHRIGVLKEAEKRELDITSKAADYIQQQTNGNASDWIINGVFNKGKNK